MGHIYPQGGFEVFFRLGEIYWIGKEYQDRLYRTTRLPFALLICLCCLVLSLTLRDRAFPSSSLLIIALANFWNIRA